MALAFLLPESGDVAQQLQWREVVRLALVLEQQVQEGPAAGELDRVEQIGVSGLEPGVDERDKADKLELSASSRV